MTKKPTLLGGIKAKLISATCMLLVAVIMVVSSTYAWFTLSTAPEVTGITTAVGANGALEMALLPANGDASGVTTATGTLDTIAANLTWGNLVDLSDGYGLNLISLYPAELNASGNTLAAAMLRTPAYGADGRVQEMRDNTITGTYSSAGTNFPVGNDYGVRAVGVASGMTARQLSYRNARMAAATAVADAKRSAADSLVNNGDTLADLALKSATQGANATYTQADVAALQLIVDDLLGTSTKTGVLEYLEQAYLQYILAYAASAVVQQNDTNDAVWSAVKTVVEAPNASIEALETALTTAQVSLPPYFTTAISAYKATLADITAADEYLDELADATTVTWGDGSDGNLKSVLLLLANPDEMKINGIRADKIKDQAVDEATGQPMEDENGDPVSNMSLIVSSVASGGLVVTMASGAGVYADIADHCGNYEAGIVVAKVTYGGVSLNNMPATMKTATDIEPPYATQAKTNVEGCGAPTSDSATDASMPITEYYGYIVDLVFRTNASDSNLLLQTDSVDRIYSDNTNEQTMGRGSTMTFKSAANDGAEAALTVDQVKNLMSCIRVVFFEIGSTEHTILATAKLDVANATVDDNSNVKANMYLYTTTGEGESKVDTLITDEANAIIKALSANQPEKVSVLVYLDGTTVENADVAAAAQNSMTGSMNLQFSSSANLVPMEYADLHIPGQGSGSNTPAATQYDVTVPTGVTGEEKATANTAYSFTVQDGYTLSAITVDGTALTADTDYTANGTTYTIAAEKVTGAIVITVTSNP